MDVTRQQIVEFTRRPLLGILSTLNPQGAPRAMPVFYEYDRTHFNVTSYANLFKVRNIRLDPRVSLVIVDTVEYGDTLTVTGTAEVTDEGLFEVYRRLNIRYLGAAKGEVTREQFAKNQPRVLIRITPQRYYYRPSMESPPE